MGAWSSRLCRAAAVLLLTTLWACSPGTPAPVPDESQTHEPKSAPPDETVDLHGEWRRWADTPKLRAEALARLESLPRFGFGRRATPEEISRIDIDVMPDGTGLPDGRGTVERGRELYKNQCVQCHGADGRGADYDALAGKGAFTVGTFWPYPTTLYDYIHRAMPQAAPGSLPPDDVYSLTAFVLYLNELLPADGSLDRESLPKIEMPHRGGFVYDDRAGGPELK
jgi:mono/diheme cytochrome c family protein